MNTVNLAGDNYFSNLIQKSFATITYSSNLCLCFFFFYYFILDVLEQVVHILLGIESNTQYHTYTYSKVLL
jgi:hypothetical protein